MKQKDTLKKDSKKQKKKIKGSVINQFNIFFVDLQMVLTFLTIIVFVLFIFHSKMLSYLQLSLGVTLLVMGYNNQIIYKRAKFTVAYVFVGIILLVLCILGG